MADFEIYTLTKTTVDKTGQDKNGNWVQVTLPSGEIVRVVTTKSKAVDEGPTTFGGWGGGLTPPAGSVLKVKREGQPNFEDYTGSAQNMTKVVETKLESPNLPSQPLASQGPVSEYVKQVWFAPNILTNEFHLQQQ